MSTDASKAASFGRWVPRALAVLAVAAATLAVFLVVSGSLSSSDEPGEQAAQTQSQGGSGSGGGGGGGGGGSNQDEPETYVVQPGDTLGGIAAKLDVPVSRLERLNPDVDPVTLPPGATLRVRR